MRKQQGFTLIELIIVIMILSILAVIILPKLINLSADAKTAATSSVAASLTAASGINYATRKANSAKGIAVVNCTDVANALQGGLPAEGYVITSKAVAVNITVNCTLSGPESTSAIFSATGVR